MEQKSPLRLMAYQGAYWPSFGGYAHHLRYRLPLLRRYGIEPWVLTHREEGLAEEEVVDDVLVRRVRVPSRMSRRSISAEASLFPSFFRHRDRYDLALLSSANVSGAFIRDICRRPVIRESVIGDDHAKKFQPNLPGKAREFFFRHVDFAIVISPALETAYLDVSWPKDRIRLIPRGVDHDIFRPAETGSEIDRLREDLGLPKRPAPLFLTVGAIRERKGQLDLVEAWRLLSPDIPAEHLIVVGPIGDDPYYQMIKRRIGDLGLGGRIHFQGRSDRVADYMRCVDGFVFASSNEGFPNSIIEAMSSGLPVVAFDIEGIIPFILDNGKDGIVLPAGNREALAREIGLLSKNPARRAELGQAARAKVIERFSLEREAEAHADLYWAVHRNHWRRASK